MALIACENCGTLVSSSNRRCGQCRTLNPHYNLPRLILLYAVLFFVLGSGFVFVLLKKAKQAPAGVSYGQHAPGRSTPM
jgi:hypothetical protein